MPRSVNPPAIEDEIVLRRAREVRLERRIEELELELSSRNTPKNQVFEEQRQELSDSIARTSDEMVDQTGRLVRSWIMAYVEQIRAVADVASSFADSVAARNQPQDDNSVADLARKLPGDIYSGTLNAINTYLAIPQKTVQALYQSYSETEGLPSSRQRSTRTQRAVRRDVETEAMRIEYALGRPVNRVILDPADNVLLNTGEVITHQAIARARQAGVLIRLLNSVYEREPELNATDVQVPTPDDTSSKA